MGSHPLRVKKSVWGLEMENERIKIWKNWEDKIVFIKTNQGRIFTNSKVKAVFQDGNYIKLIVWDKYRIQFFLRADDIAVINEERVNERR